MKKSILNFAILLSIFSMALISCSKDDKDSSGEPGGKYSINMNGKVVASGTTAEVGFLQNLATIGEGEDISLLVASVPLTVGATYQFDASNSSGTVTIMGKNLLLNDSSTEMYFSISGSVKRESATKISFQGVCSEMGSSVSHSFSGSIESDAYKLIN